MVEPSDHLNWVDPDIIVYYGGQIDPETVDNERRFKDFFEKEWPKSEYDPLRERWDKRIYDSDSNGRVLGKTAAWSYIQYWGAKKRHDQQQKAVAVVEYLNKSEADGGPSPADDDEMARPSPLGRPSFVTDKVE